MLAEFQPQQIGNGFSFLGEAALGGIAPRNPAGRGAWGRNPASGGAIDDALTRDFGFRVFHAEIPREGVIVDTDAQGLRDLTEQPLVDEFLRKLAQAVDMVDVNIVAVRRGIGIEGLTALSDRDGN